MISSQGNGTIEVQRRTDQLVKHVIEPAARECGYQVTRADQISHANMITSQVIDHLIEDPLVIADVGFEDPSVFYELAVRHAANKPVIQITLPGHKTPFEVTGNKTIPVDHTDLDSAEKGREELVAEIKTLNGNADPTNPLTGSIDLESLTKSADLQERTNAQIIARLEDIKAELREVHRALMPNPGAREYQPAPNQERETRSPEFERKARPYSQQEPIVQTLSTPEKSIGDKSDRKKPRRQVTNTKTLQEKQDLHPTEFDESLEPFEEKTSPKATLPPFPKEFSLPKSKATPKTTELKAPQSKTKNQSAVPARQEKSKEQDSPKEKTLDKPFRPGKRNHPERRFAHIGTRQASR